MAGYVEKGIIWLLFRHQGMFVDTQANTEYRALCLFIDWQDGSLLGEEVLEFGVRKMNFHFIQPIGDDILLLATAATFCAAKRH